MRVGIYVSGYYFSSMSEVLEVRSSPRALIELSAQELGNFLINHWFVAVVVFFLAHLLNFQMGLTLPHILPRSRQGLDDREISLQPFLHQALTPTCGKLSCKFKSLQTG